MKKQYPDYLRELKERADEAYFGNEVPLMSDKHYDALFGESSTIGVQAGDTPHKFPMYSLQKHYAEDGEAPIQDEELIETPKLDGCAVSLLYFQGKLVEALTRGDGKQGQPILNKMKLLVPTELDGPNTGFLQITGEVVARKDIENSRNMASGSLGLKDAAVFLDRIDEIGLEFVGYSLQYTKDYVGDIGSTYLSDMLALRNLGFTTILDSGLERFPTDGIVYRINDNSKFNQKGFTARFPRGAYAFKEKQKPVSTKLLDVVWQTGKSGKVTPIAILESVMIGEANISRATLNNMAYINALNLEIGCTVELIRAGEIIPCIIGRAD